jgi:hypothetical protein
LLKLIFIFFGLWVCGFAFIDEKGVMIFLVKWSCCPVLMNSFSISLLYLLNQFQAFHFLPLMWIFLHWLYIFIYEFVTQIWNWFWFSKVSKHKTEHHPERCLRKLNYQHS